MLKGAIIGIGKIAQESHLPAYLHDSIRNDVQIVACADPDIVSLNEAAHLYPGLRFYRSTEELLENEALGFVDICAPPVFHYEIIKKAVHKGLNIFCEKPFTTNLADAERLYQTLIEYPAVFMPCHQYRYSPIWQSFKDYSDSTDPGQASFAQFNVFRTEADKGLVALNKRWRTNPEISGGGILSDTGTHYLYLSLWIWGVPESITARTFSLAHKDYDVEDTALVILEYRDLVVEINLSWAADKRANSARLVNKSGSLIYDEKSLLKNKNGSSFSIPVPDASDKSNYVSLYVLLIREFLNSVRQEGRTLSHITEAYNTVKLLDLCYKSACNNISIKFDAQ